MESNRRSFIQKLGLSTAGLGLGATLSAEAKTLKPKEDEQVLFVGDNIAVANTAHGKVRGYILRGIHTFLF